MELPVAFRRPTSWFAHVNECFVMTIRLCVTQEHKHKTMLNSVL